MIRAGFLLLLLLAGPVRAESFPRATAPGFSAPLAADVFGTALTFMAPRMLDPVPVPRLTLWGLHGLTTLDPALVPAMQGDRLELATAGRVLFSATPPAGTDPAAWGDLAARMAEAASLASPAVRRAGTEGVIQSFFDEMFSHLDLYSRYEPPESAEAGRDRRSGVAGAGMRVAARQGRIVVTEVLADSPAADAGIVPGDTVLAVDGQRTRGHSAQVVSDWIAGPEDSTVRLLLRDRRGHRRTVDVERALVPPETVFATHEGHALVLRVTGFAGDTGERIAHELTRDLTTPHKGVRGLVLDLRGNRGGLVREAVSAVDSLLDGGIIALTVGRDRQADHVWRASRGDLTAGLPITVLVDEHTASAAEIMAAALADQRRAVVVGSATYGKGLVQAITPLPDGGELFVTWSRVLAPLGWPIQGLGVLPQVCTSKGATALRRQVADLEAGRDDMGDALAQSRAARAPLSATQIASIRSACPAAGGTAADLRTALLLLDRPAAYQAALLPEAADSRTPDAVQPAPTTTAAGVTQGPAERPAEHP